MRKNVLRIANDRRRWTRRGRGRGQTLGGCRWNGGMEKRVRMGGSRTKIIGR